MIAVGIIAAIIVGMLNGIFITEAMDERHPRLPFEVVEDAAHWIAARLSRLWRKRTPTVQVRVRVDTRALREGLFKAQSAMDDFEKSMRAIRKDAGATPTEIQALLKAVRQLSGKEQ